MEYSFICILLNLNFLNHNLYYEKYFKQNICEKLLNLALDLIVLCAIRLIGDILLISKLVHFGSHERVVITKTW